MVAEDAVKSGRRCSSSMAREGIRRWNSPGAAIISLNVTRPWLAMRCVKVRILGDLNKTFGKPSPRIRKSWHQVSVEPNFINTLGDLQYCYT